MKKEFILDKIRGDRKENFIEAQENLQRIQKEISPYIKKRKIIKNSTAGEWCETSSLLIC